MRAEHPAFRVAILLVTASPATIYERADKRARVTGREVPRRLLDDALARVPAAFALLAPLADYAAVIDNEDDRAPQLLPPATLESFAAVWEEGAGVAGCGSGGAGSKGAGSIGRDVPCNGRSGTPGCAAAASSVSAEGDGDAVEHTELHAPGRPSEDSV